MILFKTVFIKSKTKIKAATLCFVLCLSVSLISSTTYGLEKNWQYLTQYEGVDLYRYQRETEGLLPFKAEAVLYVSYARIVMALVDAERKNIWAPKLKSTTFHSQISANCFEYSEYYTTPWPFKDREFLLKGTVSYLPDRVLFKAVNSENKHLSRKDHLLANIQKLEFAIIPLSEDTTKVTFTFSGDLGGWIPAYVKTIIQKKWPVRFIQALQTYTAQADVLETERYRSLGKTSLLVQEHK